MGHYCRICGRERANEKFSGKGYADHICKDCAREQKDETRKKKTLRKTADSLSEETKAALKRTWEFRKYIRSNAFGWRSSALAINRLGEAVSEIKKVAKVEPLAAGEGVVQLCERIWPALQQVDSSSGALGTAVVNSLEALMPVLIDSPADETMRSLWLERLFVAVQEDGVEYLDVVQHYWAEICRYPALINYWADFILPMLRLAWSDRDSHGYFSGDTICLVCLVEAGRYKELKSILSLQRHLFWPNNQYWAEALLRQGKLDEAIQYAEVMVDGNGYSYDSSIWRFCEKALIDAGRIDEAYERYGLLSFPETTYLNQFRAIKKRYPNRNPRQILLDLIDNSENKGAWFASARQSGYLDIALDCAISGQVDPKTLIRAAKATAEKQPEFAEAIAMRAIELIVQGFGWEITSLDLKTAFDSLIVAVRITGHLKADLESLSQLLSDDKNHCGNDMKRILTDMIENAASIS